jgi:HEAT repeat protein
VNEHVLAAILSETTAAGRRDALENLAHTFAGANRSTRRFILIFVRSCATDSDELVRNAAVTLLGAIGTRRDGYRLRLAATDREWLVRASAASSLAELRSTRNRAALTQMVCGDPNPIVRRYAADALARQGPQIGVVGILERCAQTEDDESAAVGILFGLVSLGIERFLQSLVSLLHSNDYQVVRACLGALEELLSSTVLSSDGRSDVLEAIAGFTATPPLPEWLNGVAADIVGGASKHEPFLK